MQEARVREGVVLRLVEAVANASKATALPRRQAFQDTAQRPHLLLRLLAQVFDMSVLVRPRSGAQAREPHQLPQMMAAESNLHTYTPR